VRYSDAQPTSSTAGEIDAMRYTRDLKATAP
jgi:hypothetical protein